MNSPSMECPSIEPDAAEAEFLSGPLLRSRVLGGVMTLVARAVHPLEYIDIKCGILFELLGPGWEERDEADEVEQAVHDAVVTLLARNIIDIRPGGFVLGDMMMRRYIWDDPKRREGRE